MLFDLDAIKKRKQEKSERGIDDIVHALTDPVVLHRSPWADTLPQWVRGQIITERLCALMSDEPCTATDAEAMAYIYPASLDAPLDRDWSEIYLYVCTRTLERTGKEIPPDVRVDSLDSYRMGLLRDLKRSIYNSRAKRRPKEVKKETPKADLPTVSETMPLFAEI